MSESDSDYSSVTFVVPTYGGSDTIRETLDSIDAQTVDDCTVIVVVDAQYVDDTPEIVSTEYPDAKLYTFDKNVGHAAALNRGLRAATDEFVAICDDDIQLPSDWTETLLKEFADRDPSVALIQPRIVEPDYMRDDFGYISHFQSCGVLARRKAVKDVGYFDADYFVYRDDYQLAAELLNAGYQMVGVDSTTTYHEGTHMDEGLPPLKAYYETRNEVWNRFRYHSRQATFVRTPFWAIRRVLTARHSNTVFTTVKGLVAGISRPQYLLWEHDYCEQQSP